MSIVLLLYHHIQSVLFGVCPSARHALYNGGPAETWEKNQGAPRTWPVRQKRGDERYVELAPRDRPLPLNSKQCAAAESLEHWNYTNHGFVGRYSPNDRRKLAEMGRNPPKAARCRGRPSVSLETYVATIRKRSILGIGAGVGQIHISITEHPNINLLEMIMGRNYASLNTHGKDSCKTRHQLLMGRNRAWLVLM